MGIRTDIKPRFDADIDQWLRLLAGEQLYALVAQIHVWFTSTEGTLVLFGAPCTGKSLFASGITRLWSKDYGPLEFDAEHEYVHGRRVGVRLRRKGGQKSPELVIDVPEQTESLLRRMNKDGWVDRDMIAAHVLYLLGRTSA